MTALVRIAMPREDFDERAHQGLLVEGGCRGEVESRLQWLARRRPPAGTGRRADPCDEHAGAVHAASASAAESIIGSILSCQRENEARSDEQCRCEPVDTQCL